MLCVQIRILKLLHVIDRLFLVELAGTEFISNKHYQNIHQFFTGTFWQTTHAFFFHNQRFMVNRSKKIEQRLKYGKSNLLFPDQIVLRKKIIEQSPLKIMISIKKPIITKILWNYCSQIICSNRSIMWIHKSEFHSFNIFDVMHSESYENHKIIIFDIAVTCNTTFQTLPFVIKSRFSLCATFINR